MSSVGETPGNKWGLKNGWGGLLSEEEAEYRLNTLPSERNEDYRRKKLEAEVAESQDRESGPATERTSWGDLKDEPFNPQESEPASSPELGLPAEQSKPLDLEPDVDSSDSAPESSPTFIKTRELEPNQTILLDSATLEREPLYTKESEFANEKGFSGVDTMAIITAGRQNFYILDLRTSGDRTRKGSGQDARTLSKVYFSGENGQGTSIVYPGDILLVTEEFFASKGMTGYESLSMSPEKFDLLTIGRDYNNLNCDPTVSGQHFNLQSMPDFEYPGRNQLTLHNYDLTNPTKVQYKSRNK